MKSNAAQASDDDRLAPPASKIRMLECVTCRRTFFDFERRPPHKPPGNHSKCGKALRWVWVE
jgi:hypothetical protein